MIMLECCPPFQPRPKLHRFSSVGWHFIWLWFGFHYVNATFNEFIHEAVTMGREEAAAAAPPSPSETK